ncbi:hypothetical protein AB4Z22_01925 [Paenibacillus sp. TAF58]
MLPNIHISTSAMGSDWVYLISGGRAHIGAVAIAKKPLRLILERGYSNVTLGVIQP